MKYVLDASVALKWRLPEFDSAIALRLRAEARAGSHVLLAPDNYPQELSHALTRAERKGIIAIGQADPILVDILRTPPTLFDSLPLLRRAIAISSSTRHGFYDCLYVALAEREGCELITADAKLVTALQTQFPFIVPLSALP